MNANVALTYVFCFVDDKGGAATPSVAQAIFI